MRAFLMLVLLMAICFVAGALLAYPAYLIVHPLNADWPFHRIAARLAMLLLVIGIVGLVRHLKVTGRVDWGYGVPPAQFIGTFLLALILGLVSMLPIVLLLLGLDVRALKPGVTIDFGTLAIAAGGGLLSGLIVAFTEESFLRGAMFTAIARESGPRIAIVLTALIYSTLHFLSRVRIPHESVDWRSGLELLAGTFATFAHPTAILDSWLALAAVGVLLGLLRHRSGNIAACVGLHAGWVSVISVTREISTRAPENRWSFVVGDYDGVVGLLVLAWTIAIIAAYWFLSRSRRAAV
jgi:membrane protease YdiL (CAAX protease family)